MNDSYTSDLTNATNTNDTEEYDSYYDDSFDIFDLFGGGGVNIMLSLYNHFCFKPCITPDRYF